MSCFCVDPSPLELLLQIFRFAANLWQGTTRASCYQRLCSLGWRPWDHGMLMLQFFPCQGLFHFMHSFWVGDKEPRPWVLKALVTCKRIPYKHLVPPSEVKNMMATPPRGGGGGGRARPLYVTPPSPGFER